MHTKYNTQKRKFIPKILVQLTFRVDISVKLTCRQGKRTEMKETDIVTCFYIVATKRIPPNEEFKLIKDQKT